MSWSTSQLVSKTVRSINVLLCHPWLTTTAGTPCYKVVPSITIIATYYSPSYKAVLRTTSLLQRILQSITPWHMKRPVHCAEQPLGCNAMELQNSCLIVVTHEASLASRGAIYGMQNNMNLPHSCLMAQHMKRPLFCGEQPVGCKTQGKCDIHVW